MRELKDIIADARDNIMEACAAGYADGLKMAYTSDKDELCDAFIRVWNERAELLNEHGWTEAMAWLDERERDEWCAGFMKAWNTQAQAIVRCSECKHKDRCRLDIALEPDGYCVWGER